MTALRESVDSLKEWASDRDDLEPEVEAVVSAGDDELPDACRNLYRWWQGLKQPVQLPLPVIAVLAAAEAEL